MHHLKDTARSGRFAASNMLLPYNCRRAVSTYSSINGIPTGETNRVRDRGVRCPRIFLQPPSVPIFEHASRSGTSSPGAERGYIHTCLTVLMSNRDDPGCAHANRVVAVK